MREVIGAIAHPLRAAMLREIAERPRTVPELAARLDAAPSKVRYHARRLQRLRIIDIDRDTRPPTCRLGAAVQCLAGPTVTVVTITARDGGTISFPLASLGGR